MVKTLIQKAEADLKKQMLKKIKDEAEKTAKLIVQKQQSRRMWMAKRQQEIYELEQLGINLQTAYEFGDIQEINKIQHQIAQYVHSSEQKLQDYGYIVRLYGDS